MYYSTEELIKVAKLYYEVGDTQKTIAEKLNYSRPTISRMLDAAIDRGIVKVTVQYPINSMKNLEEKVKSKYNLRKVFIAPGYVDNVNLVMQDVGKALGTYLTEICGDNDVLGISWGTTLNTIPEFIPANDKKNIKIVQLNGGISKNSFSTGSIALLEKFAEAFSAEFHLLSVPTIVDSQEIAEAILTDTNTKEITEMGRLCNIALFGIGKTSYDNILYQGGYFLKDEYDKLIEDGAVGDICSRYFDLEGEIVHSNLNERTIGLQLEELQNKKHSIAMAVGKDKTKAVYGAIKGNYLNTLFIDESIARALLEIKEELHHESSQTL